jgi:peptidoglycan/xylan/chitin deacetylase (PgdA/CDA1 family)
VTPGRPSGSRLLAAGAAGAAGAVVAAGAAHMVPSVVSLGQWAPVRSLPGRLCTWRGPGRPEVALTFDDGPRPGTTPAVLDRLDELGLRATFFCLGWMVEERPDLVAETMRRGHQVESHGYRHADHFAHTPRWVRSDLDAAIDALGSAGRRPRWLRPPFGHTTGATLVEARRHHLSPVLWSAWGREWVERDKVGVAGRVARGLGPGAVVLLHDSEDSCPPGTCRRVLDALGPIAEDLDRRGLAAVTLDELVGPPPAADGGRSKGAAEGGAADGGGR